MTEQRRIDIREKTTLLKKQSEELLRDGNGLARETYLLVNKLIDIIHELDTEITLRDATRITCTNVTSLTPHKSSNFENKYLSNNNQQP